MNPNSRTVVSILGAAAGLVLVGSVLSKNWSELGLIVIAVPLCGIPGTLYSVYTKRDDPKTIGELYALLLSCGLITVLALGAAVTMIGLPYILIKALIGD